MLERLMFSDLGTNKLLNFGVNIEDFILEMYKMHMKETDYPMAEQQYFSKHHNLDELLKART